MALSRDVMGGGFSAGQAQAIGGAINSAVAAAGTTLATATALLASNNVITSGTGGVALPTSAVNGDEVLIFNKSGVTIVVYPPTATAGINQLAVGVGFNLPNNTTCQCNRMTSTLWTAMVSA